MMSFLFGGGSSGSGSGGSSGSAPASPSSQSPQHEVTTTNAAPAFGFGGASAATGSPSYGQHQAHTAAGMLTGITFDPRTFAPTIGANHKEVEYLQLDTTNPLSAVQHSAQQGRGWSERMCFNVGSFYFAGLALGGGYGFLEGVRSPLGNGSAKLRLNTVLNACTRRGPFLGNSAAVGALFYTTFDSLVSQARGGKSDIWNDVLAASLAGGLFRATSGIKAMGQMASFFTGVSMCSLYAMHHLKSRFGLAKSYI